MAGKPSTKLFYKIGEVCRLTGIKPHILRYWEAEFPVLAPRKSSGGQRVYQQKDLDTVFRIKRMLYEEGFTIVGARKKLSGRGKSPAKTAVADRPAETGPGWKEGESQGSFWPGGQAAKTAIPGGGKSDDPRLADALVRFKKEIKELLKMIG